MADTTEEQARRQAVPAAPAERRGLLRLFAGPVAAVVVVLGLSALAVFTVGAMLLGYIGYAIAAIAVPYTAVAVVVAVVGHLRVAPRAPIPDARDGRPRRRGDLAATDRDVQQFELFSQRASLVLAIVLLVELAVGGILVAVLPPGSSGISEYGFLALAGGSALVVGSVFTIGVNMPQLYGRRVIALERHAVATRTGAWRIILLSWVLSPLLWIGYSTAVAVVMVPTFFG
jgi:small-conductance mechanosensitive channel